MTIQTEILAYTTLVIALAGMLIAFFKIASHGSAHPHNRLVKQEARKGA